MLWQWKPQAESGDTAKDEGAAAAQSQRCRGCPAGGRLRATALPAPALPVPGASPCPSQRWAGDATRAGPVLCQPLLHPLLLLVGDHGSGLCHSSTCTCTELARRLPAAVPAGHRHAGGTSLQGRVDAAGCRLPWVCLPSTEQHPQMTPAQQLWAGAKPQPWSNPWLRISPGLLPVTGAGSCTRGSGQGRSPCLCGAGAAAPAPALPRSHGCRRLGGTEVPRAWWGTSTQWLPSPTGRIWGSSSVPPGGPLTAQGNGAKGSCCGPLAWAHQPITSLPGGATLSCQCCRKGHVGMEQGTSTAGLAGEQRVPRATTHRLSTSPAAASHTVGDHCALVAPMWGLQASPQTHCWVQRSPRSPRMPWCFGPRSAHRGLGERGPLHQLWCGDNSPGPHSVPAGLGAKGRRSHHAGRGGGSS